MPPARALSFLQPLGAVSSCPFHSVSMLHLHAPAEPVRKSGKEARRGRQNGSSFLLLLYAPLPISYSTPLKKERKKKANSLVLCLPTISRLQESIFFSFSLSCFFYLFLKYLNVPKSISFSLPRPPRSLKRTLSDFYDWGILIERYFIEFVKKVLGSWIKEGWN